MAGGIDLQQSFVQWLEGLGATPGLAHVLWLPLPMVLVLTFATFWALVATWLERKVSAAVQQVIGPEYAGPVGMLIPLADVVKLLV